MAFFPKIAAVAPKKAFSVWLHPAGKQRFSIYEFPLQPEKMQPINWQSDRSGAKSRRESR